MSETIESLGELVGLGEEKPAPHEVSYSKLPKEIKDSLATTANVVNGFVIMAVDLALTNAPGWEIKRKEEPSKAQLKQMNTALAKLMHYYGPGTFSHPAMGYVALVAALGANYEYKRLEVSADADTDAAKSKAGNNTGNAGGGKINKRDETSGSGAGKKGKKSQKL